MDAAISKANDRLNFVSQDNDFLRLYEMREKAAHDQTAILNTALEKRTIKIATSLLSEGMSFESIQKHTGLDIETIKSLG